VGFIKSLIYTGLFLAYARFGLDSCHCLQQTGPTLEGAGPNAVLCKTYSVLLCEQLIVDNPSVGPN
jgi:hypothetical protein